MRSLWFWLAAVAAALLACPCFAATLAPGPRAVSSAVAPNLLAVDADGRVLVAARAFLVDGEPVQIVARLLSTGARDASFTASGVFGEPYGVAPASDGSVNVWGQLAAAGGQPRSIVRFAADGAFDAAWEPVLTGNSGTASVGNAIATPQGLLVQGDFTAVGGVPRPGLARLRADGSLDLAFDPPSRQYGPACTDPSGNVYVRTTGGQVRKLDANTGQDAAGFSPIATAGQVVAVQSGKIFVSWSSLERYVAATGAPLSAIRLPVSNHFAITPDWVYEIAYVDQTLFSASVRRYSSTTGATDAGFVSPVMGAVAALVPTVDGALVTARSVAGSPGATGVHRLDASGSLAAGFAGDVRGMAFVTSILKVADHVVVSGVLSYVDDVPTAAVARIDATSFQTDGSWHPNLGTAVVQAMEVVGDALVIAGTFAPDPRRLLRVDWATGAIDVAWPSPGGANGIDVPRLLSRANGSLLVAGHHGLLCGQSVSGLASITLQHPCSVDASVVGTLPDRAIAIIRSGDGELILAGEQLSPSRIERRLADGSPDPTWHVPVTNNEALTIISGDSGTFVGGAFYMVDNHARHGLVRLGSDGAVDPAWTADAEGVVTALALLRDGRLIVARRVASTVIEFRDAISGRLTSEDAVQVAGDVRSIAEVGGELLIGGQFDSVDGERRISIARLTLDTMFVGSFE